MTDLELTRSPEDRRLYVLDGVGTLRLSGLLVRTATAEAGGASWTIARASTWSRTITATDDATGTLVGEFLPRAIRRGGELTWAGRDLSLRPASAWRERYALADGDVELVTVEGKGWGKRPVLVTTDDVAAVDPGLLLFAVFIVRRLAEDASSAAGASSSTAAMG